MSLLKLKFKPVYLVIIFIIIYAVYFSYYTILKHYTFHSFAYDLGVFMQFLWTTLEGHGLFYASLLDSTVWSWHFQPILFFILPFYAILPRAETLLVLQSIVLALGALPIYLIARDELGEKMGVAFAAMYLLYPALHGVNSFDFHPEVLTLPVILFSFYMFKKRHYKRGIALAVLAMMGKETIPLTIIFMGLYFLWVERKKFRGPFKWKGLPEEREIIYPLILVLIGCVWFYMAFNIIIPHLSLSGTYPYLDRYGNIFNVAYFDISAKLRYLFLLFAPLFFLSLLKPSVLLISLPAFAIILLSGQENMYRIDFHYSAEVIPWLFISCILGIKWLSTISRDNIKAFIKKLLYILVPATIIVTLLISPSPIALKYSMPKVGPHQNKLQQMINIIPEGASVYAQNDLFPHENICYRMNSFSQTITQARDTTKIIDGNYDFIFLDSTSGQFTLSWINHNTSIMINQEYGIYAEDDGILLLKKGFSGEPIDLSEKYNESK